MLTGEGRARMHMLSIWLSPWAVTHCEGREVVDACSRSCVEQAERVTNMKLSIDVEILTGEH